MRCSKCPSLDTKVIESREVGDSESIRRRRSCVLCGYRFTTYERTEQPQLSIQAQQELPNFKKSMQQKG